MQKGPEYFVEAAALVLQRTRNIRFCFAGSGDMMEEMIELATTLLENGMKGYRNK
jgi:glycosyltransferase involved in cell wall biosynthesis